GTSSVDGQVSVVNFTVGGTQYQAGEPATIANVGTLVIAANGAYTFSLAANYNGSVPTVSYTVTDGSGSNDTSTLNISVTPVNDNFTDASETVTTNEDTPVTGSVLTGTSSVDGLVNVVNFTVGGTQYQAGEPATIANVGTLVIAANGAYTFTPAENYNGTVPTVSYSVTDGSGTDVTSTLNISVTPVNDNFSDTSETVSSPEDTVATGSVLTGTSSVDGQVNVVNFTVGGTQYQAGEPATIANVGTLVIAANGDYTFSLAANYNGTVPTVSYSVTDGSGADVTSTLNISVTPVDDLSVLTADTDTVEEDHVATGNVLGNDHDVDNALSVAKFTVGGTEYTAGGTATIENVGKLTLGASGDYTFTPADNWSGNVPTVTYTTNTGSSTTLDIGVTAVADKPAIMATTPSVTSTGLTEQVWAPSTALYNALGSGGNGATAATLIAGINSATVNVNPAITTTVHDFASSANVDQGTATKASGLIYLEAGKTYTFAGNADDSLAVTVGGNTVASATWGNQSGAISGSGFMPTVSGYYTLDVYHFNQSGPGSYNLTVSVNGGTATSLSASDLLTFTSVDDIAKAGLTVSDLHGLNGEGYYTVSSINHGQENTFIKVSPIT
ncbi:MAG: tandem-95 repeat protein, partial [Pseudomonas fluorescens]|nr:tandem-95 repeat protein [Pseudomonas fluorescens]